MFGPLLMIAVLVGFALAVRQNTNKVSTNLPQLGMALITPGPMVGEASGRIGGTIFSHNRGGMYVRNGVVPTKVVNPYTEGVRGILSICARAWGLLDSDQRKAWQTYCVENPVVNRLGQKKTLTGHMAYNAVNSRLLQSGDAAIELPPNANAPAPLTTLSAVVDVTAGTGVVTFAPTPIGADNRVWIWAAVISKPGVSYVGNKFRLVTKTAKNAATGVDIYDALTARFGTLQEGDVVALRAQVLDSTTGLVSGFLSSITTAVV